MISQFSLLRAILSSSCVGVLLLVAATTARNAEPKWAGKVEPLVIQDLVEYNQLAIFLRQCIKEFYEQNLFDGISDFVDFHDAYKKYRIKSPSDPIENFYKSFIPRVQNSATYGFQVSALITHIIDSATSLDSKFKKIVGSIYAVSADKLTTRTLQDSIKTNEAQPTKKKMYDILACIKLSINQKITFILIDPTHGSSDPKVIFNSAKPIGTSIRELKEFVDNNFDTISPNQNYVYTLYYDNKNNAVHALVYAGFPYLSTRDFTQKPSLLDPYRAIIKRDQNGKPLAMVRFNAVPGDINFAKFCVILNGQSVTLSFKNLMDKTKTLKESLGDEGFNIIQSANKEMQMKKGELEEKLKAAGSAMENIQFLREIQTLNRQLS